MTSSLVGSEMCIRDSQGKAQGKPEGKAKGGRQTPGQERKLTREKGPLPVSYTHLTLPTICSV
eukprot:11917570-Prorocentrum_lima.AAC.1